jgi:hypothetical protein
MYGIISQKIELFQNLHISINIVMSRLKAGILEAALFPRQRTREVCLPNNAQQTVRTLHDNDWIVTLVQAVVYPVPQEPT